MMTRTLKKLTAVSLALALIALSPGLNCYQALALGLHNGEPAEEFPGSNAPRLGMGAANALNFSTDIDSAKIGLEGARDILPEETTSAPEKIQKIAFFTGASGNFSHKKTPETSAIKFSPVQNILANRPLGAEIISVNAGIGDVASHNAGTQAAWWTRFFDHAVYRRRAAPDNGDGDLSLETGRARNIKESALLPGGVEKEAPAPNEPPIPARAKLDEQSKAKKWASRSQTLIQTLFLSTLLVAGPLSNAASAFDLRQISAGDAARIAAFAVPLAAVGAWGLVKISVRLLKKKGISFLSPLENFRPLAPLHKPVLPRFKHYLVNLSFGAVAIAATICLVRAPYLKSADLFMAAHGIGLLHWLKIDGWANTALSIPLIDFMAYWWHRLLHRRLLLWRLHKVHHSDLDLDFSTSYRTHPLEMLLYALAQLAQYLIVGPTLAAIAIYEVLMTVLGGFHHANVKIPEPWESRLSRILITSRRHYLHHSVEPADFNSNYGNLFSFWDKLMGTWKDYDSAKFPDGVAAGLKRYRDPQDLTFIGLMMMPFRSRTSRASASKTVFSAKKSSEPSNDASLKEGVPHDASKN